MNIRIANFKAIKDEQINFQDTTLLIGANGYGKSSVFKAVNFLKEYFAQETSDLILSQFQLFANSSYLTSRFNNFISNNRVNRTVSFELPHLEGSFILVFGKGESSTSIKLKEIEYKDSSDVYSMENQSSLKLVLSGNGIYRLGLKRDVGALLDKLEESFGRFDLVQKKDKKLLNKERSNLSLRNQINYTSNYLKKVGLDKFPNEMSEFSRMITVGRRFKNSIRINRDKDTLLDICYKYFLFDGSVSNTSDSSYYGYLDLVHDRFKMELIELLNSLQSSWSIKIDASVFSEDITLRDDQRSLFEITKRKFLNETEEKVEEIFKDVLREFKTCDSIEFLKPSSILIQRFVSHFIFSPILNHREHIHNKLSEMKHIPVQRQIYDENNFSDATGESLMKAFIILKEKLIESLIIRRDTSEISNEFNNRLEKKVLDKDLLFAPDFMDKPIEYTTKYKGLKEGKVRITSLFNSLECQHNYFPVPESEIAKEVRKKKREIRDNYLRKYIYPSGTDALFTIEATNNILNQHAKQLKTDIYSKYLNQYQSAFKKRKTDFRSIHAYFFLIKYLRLFKIGSELDFRSLEDLNRFILKPYDRRAKGILGFKDLGFGSQQLLTLILNITVRLGDGKTKWIMIEEPESNLHPDAQLDLIDMLVDYQKTFGIKFILETHSEYVIRYYQKLVAKGNIQSTDINVNFFEVKGVVEEVTFRDDGVLSKNIGENFYNVGSRLFSEHMSIIRKRK